MELSISSKVTVKMLEQRFKSRQLTLKPMLLSLTLNFMHLHANVYLEKIHFREIFASIKKVLDTPRDHGPLGTAHNS